MANATLTPTYDTGARSKPMTYVSIPPGREVDDDALRQAMPDLGMNTAFIADIMSSVLAHERCGRHLYRSIGGRTLNPVLGAKYETFGTETERHVEIVEALILGMGGDPQYVSPAARATEGADAKMLEATFMFAGSLDIMTMEMAMLDAVLAAEALAQANWAALAQLAGKLPEAGELADQFTQAVNEVILQKDDHVTWARDARTRMIELQASSDTVTAIAAKGEEVLARVRGWFS